MILIKGYLGEAGIVAVDLGFSNNLFDLNESYFGNFTFRVKRSAKGEFRGFD